MPTFEEIRFVRQVRRELIRYMKDAYSQARAGFLERDAKRFEIENRYPDFFAHLTH